MPYCSSAMSAVNPYDFFLDRKNLNMKYAVVGISGFDQFTINKCKYTVVVCGAAAFSIWR